MRGAQELDSIEKERERILAGNTDLDRDLPTGLVPRFERRYDLATSHDTGVPVHTITRRGTTPRTHLLVPGCRLLAERAREAGWPLTYVEHPDLIHVYPLLPIPEARRARHTTEEFLS